MSTKVVVQVAVSQSRAQRGVSCMENFDECMIRLRRTRPATVPVAFHEQTIKKNTHTHGRRGSICDTNLAITHTTQQLHNFHVAGPKKVAASDAEHARLETTAGAPHPPIHLPSRVRPLLPPNTRICPTGPFFLDGIRYVGSPRHTDPQLLLVFGLPTDSILI